MGDSGFSMVAVTDFTSSGNFWLIFYNLGCVLFSCSHSRKNFLTVETGNQMITRENLLVNEAVTYPSIVISMCVHVQPDEPYNFCAPEYLLQHLTV